VKAQLEKSKKRGKMPGLWELCRDGKLDEVRAELARGGDVNDKNANGSTALMWAVGNGHNSIVKLLLEQPAVKTNEKDNYGYTVLHLAALVNNAKGARMLLLHPGFNSANSTNINGDTALMLAVRKRNKEVLLELVKHEKVSLDLSEGAFDGRADLSLIIEDAKKTRAQDSVSECREICAQEEEEMRKIQSEGVQLLMQQQEDEMRKIKSENQKKEEELKKENREEEETLKLENQKKEQKLTKENRENEEAMQAENERALDLLLEENATQLALMLAKHEVEKKAARKEAELEAERNASASNQPQVPECPVCLDEMAPPTRIFQCRNGHLICETCKTGLRPCICPKCRQEMTGRAIDMEALLRSF